MLEFRRIGSVTVSNVDKKSVDGQLPVRLCNYTDVYYGDRISPSEALMRATATPDQVQRCRLKTGDVVITKDSETADDIGVPAYIESEALDMVCGYHLAILRPGPELHGRFLYWSVVSCPTKGHYFVNANGVTRVGLGQNDIKSTPIPKWPFGEQQQIADFLDAETARIDSLVAEYERQVDLLEVDQSSTVDDSLADLRSASPMKRLKFLTDESEDRLAEGQDVPELLSVSIHHGVVSRSSLTDKVPRADSLVDYKLVEPDQLVLNRMRAFQGGVGVAVHVGIVSPDYTVLRLSDELLPEFLNAVARSDWFVGEMTKRLRGIGNPGQGNTRTPRVNYSDLREIKIPVPTIAQQRQFLKALDGTHDLLTSELRSQIDHLTEYRQALITKAVTEGIDACQVTA